MPTKEGLEQERATDLYIAAELIRLMDAIESDITKEKYAAAYQKTMNEVFRIDRILKEQYNVPIPKYPYKRTVEGVESTCQQVNGFIAQCDESNWRSSECRAVLDEISGCANSEVARVVGEESCKPVDPGVATVAAIIEAQCSKLARGADGQNPCERRPPAGADPAQIVVDRCRPREDTLVTPDGDGTSDPSCPKADLVKFLNMALPTKDFSSILEKIGGPRPPTGTDTAPPNPRGTVAPARTPVPRPNPPSGIGRE